MPGKKPGLELVSQVSGSTRPCGAAVGDMHWNALLPGFKSLPSQA